MLNNVMVSNFTELHGLIPVTRSYRWFSWGVASLPEGKSRALCLAQLCTKYRLVSATLTVSAER